ncbi:MAG: TlpA disulfide reductase family protein [Syntrophotaleaceae bacterium]
MTGGRKQGFSRWTLAAAVALAALVALVLIGLLMQRGREDDIAVGEQAPGFELTSIDGGQVELADFRGKFVLLAFWTSWCPACREEMPALQGLYRDFADSDLALLAINLGEPQSIVSGYVEKHGLGFPVLLDSDGSVQRLYGAYQIPLFFLIDPEGRIVVRHLGPRDWSSPEVRRELSELIGSVES